MRSRILYARSPQCAALLARADELFACAEFREVKNIARNRAGFFTTAEGTVFVKRFAPGSWVRGLLERLRGSRAARSLRAAEMLTRAGFLAPAPLAAAEDLGLGVIRTSWLLSEALTGAQIMSRFIERGQASAQVEKVKRRAALSAVAECVRRLHDAGLFTSDMQETNLMLDDAQGTLRIHFVDLDGFRRLARVSWQRRRRNLVQLDRSVGRFMSRPERLRFLHHYLGVGWERPAMRELVGRLMRERDRKEREFARRRARKGGSLGVDAATGESIAPELSQSL
ncbi:MAG: lipopolysaccharide kinase InaA family protein [Candidatus Binataceae bacterium]